MYLSDEYLTHQDLCKRERINSSSPRLVFQALFALIISLTRPQSASHYCSCPGFNTSQACSAESAIRQLKFHFITAFTVTNCAADVRLCLTKLQHKPLLYLSTESRPAHLSQLTSHKTAEKLWPYTQSCAAAICDT